VNKQLPYRKEPDVSPMLARWRVKGLTGLRILFGCIWLFHAFTAWQPGFQAHLQERIASADQPAWLAVWLSFWQHTINQSPQIAGPLLAGLATLIGCCLILGAWMNTICLIGLCFSLFVWSTIKGFGGSIFFQDTTDIGLALVYALFFLGLFLSNSELSFGLDRYLNRILGRWNFLASGPVRSDNRQTPPIDLNDPYNQIPVIEIITDFETSFVGQTNERPEEEVLVMSRLQGIRGQRLAPLTREAQVQKGGQPHVFK
jgi:uncharacterized membrane protein YphA (DoxX/SURF4 family)